MTTASSERLSHAQGDWDESRGLDPAGTADSPGGHEPERSWSRVA